MSPVVVVGLEAFSDCCCSPFSAAGGVGAEEEEEEGGGEWGALISPDPNWTSCSPIVWVSCVSPSSPEMSSSLLLAAS